jgi:malate/lactate dehydrogenase
MNRTGIREVVPLPLVEEEIQMFQKSASIVKEAIQSLNL